MKAIFNLAGNKSLLAAKLEKYMPSYYTQYVELFGGTLSMLNYQPLYKYKYNILINDFNEDYTNLYKIIKSKTKYLNMIYILDKWYTVLEKNKWSKSSLIKMYKYYQKNNIIELLPILTRVIYFGLLDKRKDANKVVWRLPHNVKISLKTFIKIKESLYNLHLKLKYNNAKIFNTDLTSQSQNILKHIHKDAFVFLDPPYISYENANNQIYGKGKKIKVYSWLNMLVDIDKKEAKFMLTDVYNKKSLAEYKKLKPLIKHLNIKKIKGAKYDEIVVMNY